jgi:hypothetical protein
LSPQRKPKKIIQTRTTIKVQSTSGDSEEALRFEGNRPTPTKVDAATASFSMADKNATPAERLKIWSDFP